MLERLGWAVDLLSLPHSSIGHLLNSLELWPWRDPSLDILRIQKSATTYKLGNKMELPATRQTLCVCAGLDVGSLNIHRAHYCPSLLRRGYLSVVGLLSIYRDNKIGSYSALRGRGRINNAHLKLVETKTALNILFDSDKDPRLSGVRENYTSRRREWGPRKVQKEAATEPGT